MYPPFLSCIMHPVFCIYISFRSPASRPRSSQAALSARYPALGHRGMRGEGDATFPRPSSLTSRPGRGPRAGHRTRYLAPALQGLQVHRGDLHGDGTLEDVNGDDDPIGSFPLDDPPPQALQGPPHDLHPPALLQVWERVIG